jgi:hypothetical protein
VFAVHDNSCRSFGSVEESVEVVEWLKQQPDSFALDDREDVDRQLGVKAELHPPLDGLAGAL